MAFVRDWWRTLRTVALAAPGTSALLAGLVLISGILPACELWAFWRLMDAVATFAGWSVIWPWLGWLALFMSAQALVARARGLVQVRFRRAAEGHLTAQLLLRAAATPLLELEAPAYFNLYERASQGVRQHTDDLVDATLQIVQSTLWLVALIATLAAMNWPAALVLAGAGLPAWALQARQASNFGKFMQGQVPRARYLDYLGELLVGRAYAQEVRLFGTAPGLLARWWRDRVALGRDRERHVLRRGLVQVLVLSLGDLAYVGALGVLGLAVLAGRSTFGAFAAALKSAEDVKNSVLGLMFQVGRLQQAGVFVRDVWAFLGPAPMAAPTRQPLRASVHPVQFSQVSFTYPGRTEPALQEISFTAQPGELIALVGENGAGKSTLVKLLLGLYPPSAGAVAIGASAIAPVFQDFNRYKLTVAENIAVGEITALHDQARVEMAAASADANAFVADLPEGYATQLGKEFDGGQELSGGQWQRLAIARAYMREADLLVLDEPTAALDPLAEVEVFRRFRDLTRGRTAFFISHRLGAARLADRVLVLKGGRLVEDGHHDALIAQGGVYAALFGAQAAWYTGGNSQG